MRFPGVPSSCLLLFIAHLNVFGQAVVSTRSGLLNFFEGTVLLDDQPLNQKAGTFVSVKEGSTLRTEDGRAELLLTPGVFLRIDENGALRMVSSALANTRVEFLKGSAILDSNEAAPGNSLVLVYKTFELRFPKPGVYRLDGEPGVFETYTGEAEIRASGQVPKTIDESHQFFFGIGMDTKKYGDGAVDAFSEWARDRAETITADSRAAAQSSTGPPPDSPLTSMTSPFITVTPAPAPLYASPVFPTAAGTGIIDGGFYGLNSPFYNPLFPGNPFVVVYVFPRVPRQNPGYGTPPRKSGSYPILPPTHTGYPRPTPLRPTPIPLRQSFAGSAAASGRVRPVAPLRLIPPMRPLGPVRPAAPMRPAAPVRMPASPVVGSRLAPIPHR